MVCVFLMFKEIRKEETFVAIPKRQYEKFLLLARRSHLKEEDADDAVQVFRTEKKKGLLKTAKNFRDILK